MRPGDRGLLVLAIVTPLGVSLGVIFSQDRIDCHAIALGAVALVFWSWALYKVIARGDEDLGVISFALVMAAAAYSRCALKAYAAKDTKLTRAWNSMFMLTVGCGSGLLSVTRCLIQVFTAAAGFSKLFRIVGQELCLCPRQSAD